MESLCALAVTALALVAAAPASAQLGLSFGEATVSASGLSAGGTAVWHSVSHEQSGFLVRVMPRNEVTAVAADGSTVLDLGPGGVALRSVWAVVDLKTGMVAVAAPPGQPLRLDPPPTDPFAGAPHDPPDRVTLGHGRLEVLVVRPGTGAWAGAFADGTESDGDGLGNGAIQVHLPWLHALGEPASPPPGTFQDGDVIVAIDPERLRVRTLTCGAAP